MARRKQTAKVLSFSENKSQIKTVRIRVNRCRLILGEEKKGRALKKKVALKSCANKLCQKLP